MKKIILFLLLSISVYSQWMPFRSGQIRRDANYWLRDTTKSVLFGTATTSGFSGFYFDVTNNYFVIDGGGYIRYEAGVLEFSNDGSTWQAIPSALSSSGGWDRTAASHIYNTNIGDELHIRTAAGDTTGVGKVNFYDDVDFKNKTALESTVATDMTRIYPYDNGSKVSINATIDDNATERTITLLSNETDVRSSWVSFDGVNDYYSVADNDNLDFGTGDFCIEVRLKPTDVTTFQAIVTKGAGGTGVGYAIVIQSGDIRLLLQDASTATTYTFSNSNLVIGANYHILVTLNRDGNADLYQNGVFVQSLDISARSASLSGTFAPNIGKYSGGSDYYKGSTIDGVRLYNRALTASEVTALYNNGHPELYSLPYADRGASNTTIATYDSSQAVSDAFTLEIGKKYKWTKGNADSLAFNGDTLTVSGTDTSFTATATAGIAFGDLTGSALIPIGAVAEFYPENATSYSWIESSGNNLHAQGSGSPTAVVNPLEDMTVRQFKGSVAANTNTALTSIIPKGYRIVSIRAVGSDSLAAIKIGTASAGEQVVASTTTIGTTPKILTLASTANDAYSESADVTLYARHDTSASGKTMNLIITLEKVNK